MEQTKTNLPIECQFDEVIGIILQHKNRAARMVNEELLLTAWHVGKYVSFKLKNEVWGSKVVTQLSEYIRSKRPDIKGFSRSSIYNMVMFYDEYSSESFATTVLHFLNSGFIQSTIGQLENSELTSKGTTPVIVQSESAQIVQMTSGQMPKILEMTTLSNHQEILSRCRNQEERMFYILYANEFLFHKSDCNNSLMISVICFLTNNDCYGYEETTSKDT
jgi:hypothetical protein